MLLIDLLNSKFWALTTIGCWRDPHPPTQATAFRTASRNALIAESLMPEASVKKRESSPPAAHVPRAYESDDEKDVCDLKR